MKTIYKSKNHRKFYFKAHLILVTKYRKNLLIGKIKDFLKLKIIEISKKYNFQIIEMETDLNHIHILISYEPTISISNLIKNLKQFTTYYLWENFEYLLKKYYWEKKIFWSDGYFACSVGNVSAESIKKYIQQQG